MPGWEFEICWNEEATDVDECSRADTGDLCSHSDCSQCGDAVGAQLRADALIGMGGVIALAREVCRVADGYGVNLPEVCVTMVDLVRLKDRNHGHKARAWAEGICEELSGTGHVEVPYPTEAEELAHHDGRELVKRWQSEQQRVLTEARRRPATISAAGAHSAPTSRPSTSQQPSALAEPGLESWAQHDQSSAEREQPRPGRGNLLHGRKPWVF